MSKVVLTGEIEFKDFRKYEELVAQPDVTEIDISQFSIKDRSYKEFEEEFEIYEEGDKYYALDDSVRPLSLLAKLVLNKEFATSYVVENGAVFSSDKRVLVCYPTSWKLNVPNGVEIIGHYAFCCCNDIKAISFPQSLKRIGNNAFEDCENINAVVLPDSVTQLGECCFSGCEIKDLKLSNSLEIIPACCFTFGCLDDVDIPASVKKIEASAFSGNYIKEVYLTEGLETIGNDVFGVPGFVYFPSTIREIDKEFFCESPIVEPKDYIPYIEVSERNPLFFSKDGTLYSREKPNEPYLGYPYSGYKFPK